MCCTPVMRPCSTQGHGLPPRMTGWREANRPRSMQCTPWRLTCGANVGSPMPPRWRAPWRAACATAGSCCTRPQSRAACRIPRPSCGCWLRWPTPPRRPPAASPWRRRCCKRPRRGTTGRSVHRERICLARTFPPLAFTLSQVSATGTGRHGERVAALLVAPTCRQGCARRRPCVLALSAAFRPLRWHEPGSRRTADPYSPPEDVYPHVLPSTFAGLGVMPLPAVEPPRLEMASSARQFGVGAWLHALDVAPDGGLMP